jgi:hypothetical protein
MAEDTVVIRLQQDMLVGSEWHKAGAVVGVPKKRAKALVQRGLAVAVERAGNTAAAGPVAAGADPKTAKRTR